MRYIALLILLSVSLMGTAQDHTKESKQEKDARMKWWRDATFGMFIHWGAYAVPGTGNAPRH